MNKSTTNILVILGILTICFGAYYVFTATDLATSLSDTRSDSELQAMLNRTQVFIDRRQILDQVQYDFGLLENESFLNLESYRLPIASQPIGRANPFDLREAPVAPNTLDSNASEVINEAF